MQSLSHVLAAQRSLDQNRQKSIHIVKYGELQQDILHMTGYIMKLLNLFDTLNGLIGLGLKHSINLQTKKWLGISGVKG